MPLVATPYDASFRDEWNAFVATSRQGTFLFDRRFMDYHSDRFRDASLLVRDERKGSLVALLPANVARANEHCIQSHGGLTYGGLLTHTSASAVMVGEALEACMSLYRQQSYRTLTYKPVPHIYHTCPAEEDLYWLHRLDARLTHRSVSSAIRLADAPPFSELRRRKVHKAERSGELTLSAADAWLPAYWDVLTQVLTSRHATRPVHTLEEITRLARSFPRNIRLLVALKGGREDGDTPHVVAGCLLFVMPRVVHVQYIAASDEGRDVGALDWIFNHLVADVPHQWPSVAYLDFGISTEQGGRVLNEGLIFQKEGFGARGICYDEYELSL